MREIAEKFAAAMGFTMLAGAIALLLGGLGVPHESDRELHLLVCAAGAVAVALITAVVVLWQRAHGRAWKGYVVLGLWAGLWFVFGGLMGLGVVDVSRPRAFKRALLLGMGASTAVMIAGAIAWLVVRVTLDVARARPER